MIPVDAFQTAVRVVLLADPVISQHVAPAHIRVGTLRPAQMPALIIAPTRSEILGRASGGQIVAELRAMMHVWASADDDSNVAQTLGAAAVMALLDAPRGPGFAVDDWERPALVWTEDPGVGGAAHGAIAMRAVIRWKD
ncbi:DUF3168 domain-containing protein [Paracoccus liaowanqingii]|uniref:DUF3168 domain-containing protein n=1 Tax=Paracoccus liaowanqingii TaxID=2560053 RepID=A0A4Z1CSX7_9RHOB|nr:DUF3168 domain-containing protein [Paracoccus liaowanqingii]TGN68276.1 DUF3168 domain-containing protein [Paracoccus liaowanqingii]